MDSKPEAYISDRLGCQPTLVDARYSCGASRPRLFWADFEIGTLKGESRNPRGSELRMQDVPSKSDFWDEGWGPHQDFQCPFPCLVGWEIKQCVPRDPRGFLKASRQALARWEQDHWACGIRFYEDQSRAWKADGTQSRVISLTECERLLGFPVGWTDPGSEVSNDNTPYQRRNAVGNAFAVPVTTRLLFALTQALTASGSKAFRQSTGSAIPW